MGTTGGWTKEVDAGACACGVAITGANCWTFALVD